MLHAGLNRAESLTGRTKGKIELAALPKRKKKKSARGWRVLHAPCGSEEAYMFCPEREEGFESRCWKLPRTKRFARTLRTRPSLIIRVVFEFLCDEPDFSLGGSNQIA